MPLPKTLLPLLVCMPLLGCTATFPTTDAEATDGDTALRPPAIWNRQGLEEQPRIADYRDRLPGDLGVEPGTTDWQAPRQPLPDALGAAGQRHASPGALLQALDMALELAAPLGDELWEQTQRIHLESDRAIGLILQWGMKDDAIQGQDYRVSMARDAEGWYVERLETRYHCGRGVSEADLCL